MSTSPRKATSSWSRQRRDFWETVMSDSTSSPPSPSHASQCAGDVTTAVSAAPTVPTSRRRPGSGGRRRGSGSGSGSGGGGGGGSGSGGGGGGGMGDGIARRESPCPQCPAQFKRKYDLAQHVAAVHDKVRPFHCDSCDSEFAHKGTLSKHVRTVHRGEKPYVCEHCGQRFSERGNVTKHKKRSRDCRDKDVPLDAAAQGSGAGASSGSGAPWRG